MDYNKALTELSEMRETLELFKATEKKDIDELCERYTLRELATVVVDLERQLEGMNKIAVERKKECNNAKCEYEKIYKELMATEKETQYKISDLESELATKDKLLQKQYEKDRIAELDERHLDDCIYQNQLLTTIDVLVDRYAKLREMKGV